MIKSYFKTIIQNFWKNKLYTSINVLCLSIGIAALVWGIQTYRYSFSFDNFHKDTDKVYRVLSKMQGIENTKGICPAPVATFAKQDFAGITQSVRLDSRWMDIKGDQTEAFTAEVHFASPDFFNVFNFPVLRGHVDLASPSAVAITEQAAKKYFGNVDPVGKVLTFYSAETYKKSVTVTALLKDVPPNSTIHFQMITTLDNLLKQDGSVLRNDDWGWFSNAVFLKIPNPADAAVLEKKLAKYIPLEQQARGDLKMTEFKISSVDEVAKYADRLDSNALYTRPDDAGAYGPLVLSILVLLSACLNFANTSISQSNRRLKEMGIRKVMGSSRRQIILQQLLECGLIVLVSIGLSILINKWWLPEFNSMFSFANVSVDYSDTGLLIILSSILLLVTLLAGGYPAFYISGFNANHIFKGSVKFGGRNLFSKFLLCLQIVISFITVIAGIAFSRNAAFQKNYDYGYNKDNTLGFFVTSENDYHALKNAVTGLPGIDAMAGARQNVGYWQRTVSIEYAQQKTESQYMAVGENYVNTMQLNVIEGRDFNRDGAGDIGKSILINQHLAAHLGWKEKDAIGKQIRLDTAMVTVVGVLKDFNGGNFFTPISNAIIAQTTTAEYTQLIIRAKPGQQVNVRDRVQAEWKKIFPLKPCNSFFQNEVAAEVMHTNNSIATVFLWFAVISVLMAATGLFALISLTLLKKNREIAIRKVVGAQATHIYRLVLKGYVFIILLGSAFGCYAGYVLSKLLMDLVFRIHAGVETSSLMISFICMMVIIAVTVGSRILFVWRTKPTDVLKGD